MNLNEKVEELAKKLIHNGSMGLVVGWPGMGFWTFRGVNGHLDEHEFKLAGDAVRAALREMAAWCYGDLEAKAQEAKR